MLGTEELLKLAREAEDAGKDIFVSWHIDYDLVEEVEIDTVVYENDLLQDELNDIYWNTDEKEARAYYYG